MKSKDYKKICDTPNVLSSITLRSTLLALRKVGAKETKLLEEILSGTPIPFPEQHFGNADQHHFIVDCSELEAEIITDILFQLEASSVPGDGIATVETYNYVKLVNIWSNLTEYLNKNNAKHENK